MFHLYEICPNVKSHDIEVKSIDAHNNEQSEEFKWLNNLILQFDLPMLTRPHHVLRTIESSEGMLNYFERWLHMTKTPVHYKGEMHGNNFLVSTPGTLGYKQVTTNAWLSSACINDHDGSELTVVAILTFDAPDSSGQYAMVVVATRSQGQYWPTFSIILVTDEAILDPTGSIKTGTYFGNFK